MKYSNIPSKPAYGFYLSQLIRVCGICTNDKDFEIAMQKITLEFVTKSFHKANLLKGAGGSS